MKKVLRNVFVLCALPLISLPTIAADTVWNFDNPYNLNNRIGNYGSSYSTSVGDVSVNVLGWSYDSHENKLVSSSLGVWSGSGMGSLNSKYDQHTIDNYGRSDFLLFSFSDAVNVSDIKLGYVERGYDSDVSVAAFDSLGSIDFTSWSSAIDSAIYSTSYNNVANVSPDLSSFGSAAKFWLIGAYNKVFGGDLDRHYDKFKLLALTTSTPKVDVPAPATALLFGALGLLVLRRRK